MNNKAFLLLMAHWARFTWKALLVVPALAALEAGGLEIWNGPNISFTKPEA
jgi:hypothetical protein